MIGPGLNFDVAAQFQSAISGLLPEIGAFLLLAAIVNRNDLVGVVRRLLPAGCHVNVLSFLLDALLVAPLLGMGMVLMQRSVAWAWTGALDAMWAEFPKWLLLLVVLFVGDAIGYFRHRLEHCKWLWLFHEMHHSDRRMTWFSLYRFHPINRLTTVFIDMGALLLFGFPLWVIFMNALLRHYYGLFIHANLPWTYGALGRLFVSPAMHRWHHVRNGEGVGSNFATVFSVFDQWFGTWYVPSSCGAPLGVTGGGHDSFLHQIFSPFARLFRLRRPSGVGSDAVP
ncbi:Sterol desaturase [Stenotrophomonas maltophilia]|jgi:sterol desaturase/sphingolipid hydroxylase (fatty acid hydroxylase superfamily)|nr:Sterol desaturase [Stenotrophomonas maltophilia]